MGQSEERYSYTWLFIFLISLVVFVIWLSLNKQIVNYLISKTSTEFLGIVIYWIVTVAIGAFTFGFALTSYTGGRKF